MDYKILNLKTNSPSVDEAMAILETEIEVCKLEGVKALKVIHGYGSHGVGGVIGAQVRKNVFSYKKNKLIKDYLFGNEWDMSNKKCLDLLLTLKDCYLDEDLNNSNPGITILIL